VDTLSEVNIEVIRQTLFKAYLEDFYALCKHVGGPTEEAMCPILEVGCLFFFFFLFCPCAHGCPVQFEADRRAINITLNSFGTELTADDRKRMHPELGRLYPEGVNELLRAQDPGQVRIICDRYAV
jgi:V-type H+-transporting ATPase subunit d